MKNNLKKMGWGLLAVLALVLGVISCRKDDSSSDTTLGKPELRKLADWYQTKLVVSDGNPFSKMKPRWNSTHINEQSSQRVYEVELENPERVLAKLGRPDRSMLGREEKRHIIRLLIFENRISGKILYASYMSAESSDGGIPKNLHYRNVEAFSGTVLFYHFGGVLSNGWSYNNGKIAKQITAITKNDFDLLGQTGPKGKVMANGETKCSSGFAEKFKWGCIGAGNYENCGFTSAGYEYVTICTTTQDEYAPGHDDEPSPSGPGEYFPPIYVDCAGVENGNAYWNESCKTCMGGTTGITECPEKDIKHKLDSFPCAKSLILTMSTLNSDISNLIKNTFGRNDRINLTVEPNASLTGTNTDGQLGTHFSFTTSGKLYYDINIGINPDVLRNATKEYILVTIYHEALHAYLTFKRDELGETEFNRQFAGMFVNGGRLLGVQDPQHWTMGYTRFVNGLRDVILAYNTGFDSNRAYALALGGINTLTPAEQTINRQERNTSVAGYTGTKCP